MSVLLRLLAALLLAGGVCAQARADDAGRMILHLLDYMAVDYALAVDDAGKVLSEDEYQEMGEFAGQAAAQLRSMPAKPERAALEKSSAELAALVAAKAPPAQVATAARSLRAGVVRAYDIGLAPRKLPAMNGADALYAQQCASCHGAMGGGDGPAAKGLEPAPANLRERQAMAQKSVFSLYNTITLGVAGTSMPGFKLPEDQRWALAFHVAALSIPADERARGEASWKAGRRGEAATLAGIAALSPAELRAREGADAAALQAYLISDPAILGATQPSPLVFASERLAASLDAYVKGDAARAQQLAIQAYLEGYELAEHQLSTLDNDLMLRGERALMAYRQSVQSRAPVGEARRLEATAQAVLSESRDRVAGTSLSPEATFIAALVILLREGLEAVLVVAAILAFAAKVGEARARRYVHAGWLAAVASGVATFWISSRLIAVSGAGREVTEGLTALAAAAILLYVGFWLHDKGHAAEWQKYLRGKVGASIAGGTLWTLGIVSFLAVYRELFETILFYQALAAQSGPAGHGALTGGVAAGAVLLAIMTWAILRYSKRLPLGLFFGVSAVLMAVLAVIFTGQGIAALQEAGWVDVHVVGFARAPILGIFPTAQTLAAQAAVIALIAITLWWSRRRDGRARIAGPRRCGAE